MYDEVNKPNKDELKQQRNVANNTKNIRATVDIASKSSNLYAKAIGTVAKSLDKWTDGKATEKGAKGLEAINKASGLKGRVAQAALNKMSESGATDRLQTALNQKNNSIPNKGGNSQKTPSTDTFKETPNTDESAEGFVNFKVSPQAIKIFLIASIPVLVLIIFCCLFIAASQTYLNVIGIGAADESVNISEKIENSTDEDRNEEITDEKLGAYNVTITRKKYATPYTLTNVSSKSNTIREGTEVDLSNLQDYYGANSDKETIDAFFYKLRDIYKRYKKEINVELDLPLLMSTLMVQTKDTDVIFKSNTSENYSRENIDDIETHELDYTHDWTGYSITKNNSAHDIEILAQNMVTKDENDKYELDYDRYDKFLKVFLDKKYYTESGGVYNGLTEDLDSYEFHNERGCKTLIIEIYDAKSQYEDLVGDYKKPATIVNSSNNMFWWPIGSQETEEKNGVMFAVGTPQITIITSYYGGDDGFRTSTHGGIDVGNGGNGPGVINVIAAKSGEVVYPINAAQTQYSDNGYYGNPDGGGYGNYVKIKHSDGTYTIYAHLAKDSITVKSGDVVSQGQVIGKMGHSGSSTGTHLHFEVRIGSDSTTARTNPLEYVDPNNPRPMSYGSGSNFSLTSTTLTKEEFVARMYDYYNRSKNESFYKNFAVNSEEIYDASIENNINPELVVVTAGTEQGWSLSAACQYTNNYWGIGIPNGKGCNAGEKYNSLADGIRGYAELLSSYNEYGSSAGKIKTRYDERAEAGCDTSGHGLPGTLEGMQSIYSWIGDYRYNPGNSGLGGCYYLNIIYGQNYCSTISTCSNKNNCSEDSRTTTCEQNDYTAYQLKQKFQYRYDIFGL